MPQHKIKSLKKKKKKDYGVQIDQNQKAVISNRILFCQSLVFSQNVKTTQFNLVRPK